MQLPRVLRTGPLVLLAVAAVACGGSKAAGTAPTSSSAVPTTSSATPSPTPTKPSMTIAQGFNAFFQGCEDGDVPPAGITVTCDPSDGSDTAPGAANETCMRVAYDLGALAPKVNGIPLGVMNQDFDTTPSALSSSGAAHRLMRCTFATLARVDLSAGPTTSSLSGAVPGPAGATCVGRTTPTVDVSCVVASGAGFELVLAKPASITAALAALAADPAAG